MGLTNEKGFPHHGYLDFMENRLDPNTGTIQRPRRVPQSQAGGRAAGVLKPGYFARVRVAVGEPYKALLVAERALAATDQGQKYVLVVDDKNVVQYRPVTPGKLEGQLRVIDKRAASPASG